MNKKTAKELIFVIILLLIFILYSGMNFVIKPVRNKTAEMQSKISTKETEIKTTYYTVQSYGSDTERLKTFGEKLSAYKDSYFSSNAEHVYISHLDTLIKECEVEFESMSVLQNKKFRNFIDAKSSDYTDLTNKLVAEYGSNAGNILSQISQTNGRLDSDVTLTTISVNLSGSFDNVKKFLKEIEPKSREVIISSISIDIGGNADLNAEENQYASLTFSIDFVEIPGLEELCTVGEAEPLFDYSFPNDIITGNYKNRIKLFGR